MLLVIMGVSLLIIAFIGAVLFVVILVVAAAESLAHSLFSGRR
jgi:hypothetical protein